MLLMFTFLLTTLLTTTSVHGMNDFEQYLLAKDGWTNSAPQSARSSEALRSDGSASGGLRSLFSSLISPGRTRSRSRGWQSFFAYPFKGQEADYLTSSSMSSVSAVPIQIAESAPAAISFDMPSSSASASYAASGAGGGYQYQNGYQGQYAGQYQNQPMASTNSFVSVKPNTNQFYQDYTLQSNPMVSTNLVRGSNVSAKTQRPLQLKSFLFQPPKRRRKPTSSSSSSGATISIGGAPGGGTSIRFGKAQITFKKGSISLGPAASESRPKRYRTPARGYAPAPASRGKGVSINLGEC